MELREMGEREAGGEVRITNTEHDYGKQEMMVIPGRNNETDLKKIMVLVIAI